jgi:hypothetical protein
MDDPVIGAVTPIRLRRSCERNRLERQFLITAYEHLVALGTPAEQEVPEEDSSEKHAHGCEACGVAYG